MTAIGGVRFNAIDRVAIRGMEAKWTPIKTP